MKKKSCSGRGKADVVDEDSSFKQYSVISLSGKQMSKHATLCLSL